MACSQESYHRRDGTLRAEELCLTARIQQMSLIARVLAGCGKRLQFSKALKKVMNSKDLKSERVK